jgi:hypothetical protein
MKKIILVLIAACLAINVFPQKGDFGMGMILGNPTAFSIKWWTGNKSAIDASLGYHYGNMNHLHLNTDLLFHLWTFEKEEDLIKIYFGPGAGLGFISDLSITVRTPVGTGLYLHHIPLELFAELVPLLQIIGPEDSRFLMDGYIGARWYF